jgi:hypothetical protein
VKPLASACRVFAEKCVDGIREVAREKGVEEPVLNEVLDYRRMVKPHA